MQSIQGSSDAGQQSARHVQTEYDSTFSVMIINQQVQGGTIPFCSMVLL